MIKFERGKGPHRSLQIGEHRDRILKVGDSFYVSFRLKTSTPEFYPFQKEPNKMWRCKALENQKSWLSLKCKLENVSSPLYAYFSKSEEIWIIEG